MTAPTIESAVANLREHQRQLDEDGVEVGVSRQALDMVLGAVGSAKKDRELMEIVNDMRRAGRHAWADRIQDALEGE